MPNTRQAPVLMFSGEKAQNVPNTYQIPQNLADIIFKKLGNSSAQLRVMLVLIGTKEGWSVSEKWILDRTGLQHASYLSARKALSDRGWITLEPSKSITVNFDVIYAEKIEK